MRPTPASLLLECVLGDGLLRTSRRWQDGVARFRPAPLILFYQVGDPYSHLCARLLHRVLPSLSVSVECLLVPPPQAESYPEARAQRAYALRDCQRIAPAFGLTFEGTQQADDAQCRRVAAGLQACTSLEDFLAAEGEWLPQLFAGSEPEFAAAPMVSEDILDRQLDANDRRRRQLGHYLSGMWFFRGEWFWGLDRLPWLEERLRLAGVVGEAPLFPVLQPELACVPPATGPLECFYSFRSPYSYLVLEPLLRLLEAGVDVRLRPVLPMVMRGLPVPRNKRLYIVRDARRVAVRQGTAFGRIADPLGAGVENCLKVFPLCEGVEQQLRYSQSVGRAAWAEGLDLAREKPFRYAVERAGLNWLRARDLMQASQLPDYAEDNRQQLQELGLWGVPSFRIGDFACWGQDRLWMAKQCLGLDQ